MSSFILHGNLGADLKVQLIYFEEITKGDETHPNVERF
jgi:hypothetical protein